MKGFWTYWIGVVITAYFVIHLGVCLVGNKRQKQKNTEEPIFPGPEETSAGLLVRGFYFCFNIGGPKCREIGG